MKSFWYRGAKRIMDLALAICLAALVSPLLLVVSILIKLSDGGRVFFVHHRIGFMGRMIPVLKFRTMTPGADDVEKVLTDEDAARYYREYKLEKDPRVTPLGAFLRRWSIDELPQLFNVIRGDMSLVGPRPLVEGEYRFYTEEEAGKIQSVKPGITGYWQVYGRSNAVYETGERQALELFYVENAGLALDFKILLRTCGAVISGRGAQ